ncbi:MAG: glycosyltransferase [Saprospiraceae bacterium]|nr:glycosyltransferase [Saprospiraceae bacterium]
MKKKVIIIGTAHPLRGGLANYNERIAKAYIQNGDDVRIFNFSLQYPGFLFPGKTQYSSEPAPRDLKIETCINSVNPFNWIKVGRRIKKLKPDLVIVKFWIPFMAPCLGTINRIIKKNRYSKIISIIDNIIPHEKRIGDRILANYFAKSIDGFVAMSKSVLTDLETFDKQKPKLFNPHPLYDNFGEIIPKELAKQNLKLDKETNYLLFFGLIRDYKGLDLLLDAFADERFKELSVKLLVAGEFYSNKDKYYEQVEKLKLKEKVIFTNDFVPDSQVADYFCASDIIVQPYKDATQSGVTQIAYHFEKPMLVTDVGGLAEIVPKEVGYVVQPNAKEIADSILDFYINNKEEEFVKGAKLEKQKYSWDRMLGTIDELVG